MEEAKRCLERDGRNALTPPEEISNWLLLLRQFLNMFWLLLIAAGVLSLITYFLDTSVPLNLYVAVILFVIVIAMCLISFYEEKKAREVRMDHHLGLVSFFGLTLMVELFANKNNYTIHKLKWILLK